MGYTSVATVSPKLLSNECYQCECQLPGVKPGISLCILCDNIVQESADKGYKSEATVSTFAPGGIPLLNKRPGALYIYPTYPSLSPKIFYKIFFKRYKALPVLRRLNQVICLKYILLKPLYLQSVTFKRISTYSL